MNYIFLLLFIFLTNICFASQVVVVVGGKAITSVDVDKRIAALKIASPEVQNDDATRKYVITSLINEELFRNEALRLKLSASPEEITNHFYEMKNERGFTDAEVKRFSVNQSLRQQVESQVLWRKLINAVFFNKIKVSDAEIRDEQKIKAEKIKDVTFKQILFSSAESSKIMSLKAANCEELDQAAHRLGLPKPYRNTLPLFELNQDLQSVIRSLPVNQLSEIIDLQGQKQVIMICSKNVIQVERNVRDIENELSSRKMNAEAQKYLAELRKRICIEQH